MTERHERRKRRDSRADPLFVGATRPPMRWGVTYAALLFNLVFTMEAFLLTKNLLTLLSGRTVHGSLRACCARGMRVSSIWFSYGGGRGCRALSGTLGVEGKQLQPAGARSAPAVAAQACSNGVNAIRPQLPAAEAVMLTLKRAGALAPGVHGRPAHPLHRSRSHARGQDRIR